MSARFCQPHERVASGRRFEVEDDAAFAAVDGDERGAVRADARAHLPRGIPFRRLDLDDVGAQIGQLHRAERAGHDLAEVEDADAGKGAGHVTMSRIVSEPTTTFTESKRLRRSSPSTGPARATR